MIKKYTTEELNKCSKQELMIVILSMQEQMDKMNENLENLIELVQIANQKRFGRNTEKLDTMDGQLSFLSDHIHMLVSISPKLSVSQFMGFQRKKCPYDIR